MQPEQDRPSWYVTEYPLIYKVQLLKEEDKEEERREDCVYHGPFETPEEAIAYQDSKTNQPN